LSPFCFEDLGLPFLFRASRKTEPERGLELERLPRDLEVDRLARGLNDDDPDCTDCFENDLLLDEDLGRDREDKLRDVELLRLATLLRDFCERAEAKLETEGALLAA
jgi:hypothetical protein